MQARRGVSVRPYQRDRYGRLVAEVYAGGVNLGLEYLDQMRTALGALYPALAAYNAGPGNAANWAGLVPSDPDLYLEVIRLEEPRNYIRAIYEMYAIYKQLYDRTP